ncbi:kazrin isoform 2-T2 [Spheniscus humboldti]
MAGETGIISAAGRAPGSCAALCSGAAGRALACSRPPSRAPWLGGGQSHSSAGVTSGRGNSATCEGSNSQHSAAAGGGRPAAGGGSPAPANEGNADERPGGDARQQVAGGALGHRAEGAAGAEGAGAGARQGGSAGHESRPQALEGGEDGPGEPDAAAVRHAGEPRGAAPRLHQELRAAQERERGRGESPGEGEGPPGAGEVGAATASQGGDGPRQRPPLPARPERQPHEGAGGRAGHGQAVPRHADQGRPQAPFLGHAGRDGAERQPGVGDAGRPPADGRHPAEPADPLPLAPPALGGPASGQSESLSFPAAVHHLRRLCGRGRPVVHTERHQLAPASNALALQRGQSWTGTEELAQPNRTVSRGPGRPKTEKEEREDGLRLHLQGVRPGEAAQVPRPRPLRRYGP